MKKSKEIKLITFDLDDTLWDNMPIITRAEIDTRKYIEERVGKIEWGDLNDFLNLREELIKEDPSIAWDISKLRKEIFRKKLAYVKPQSLRDKIVEEAFKIFINKRHEIQLFDGVENALSELSNKYILGVLTNGNADVYRFDFGKYFKFSISSLEAKNSKPNRAHFDKALEEVENIAFDEIIHIGDHQINDILFASKLGIESLWFNKNNVDWEQEFEKPYEFNSWELLPKIIEIRYE
ncbi:HAD-IA family hydrolase [Gammaproteobacteria bacterium]|nr:HAD-IA family hydrolase [Gammaproteobacteria bacterium]